MPLNQNYSLLLTQIEIFLQKIKNKKNEIIKQNYNLLLAAKPFNQGWRNYFFWFPSFLF